MSVLVFLNFSSGNLKKSALELSTLARKIGTLTKSDVSGIYFSADGKEDAAVFSSTGLNRIYRISGADILHTPDEVLVHALYDFLEKKPFSVLLFPFDTTGKSLAPLIAALTGAGFVSAISEIGDISGEAWMVKKNIFSGKAHVWYEVTGSLKVFSLMPNSLEPEVVQSSPVIEDVPVALKSSPIQIKEIKKLSEGSQVPLPEAERVVSGGRGLKGPENWHLVEELARELNASTACSRPVADMHWRPHHEHVGQTGIAIRPNLYVAIGISGAIQHLAGVNGSKTIVVINNDKEAPFFKSADYGVVGDAFSVVPKWIAAIRKWKEQNT